MSDPTEPFVPVAQFVISVSLPETATPEQRDAFLRALAERGASPDLIVTIGLPASATPEQRKRFQEALAEVLPIDTKPVAR